MPLSGVTTNVQQGGIGRRAPNNDKISALLWFSATLPAGFSTTDRVKKVYTLAQAEALGILDTISALQVLHYQVKEYFRIQPEGELWIGVFAVPGGGTYDFTEIGTMTDIANGEFRQLGIYANLLDYAAAQATTIQGVVALQYPKGARFSVIYAPNFPGATNWTTVTDLRTLNAPKVTVLIAQDGGGQGAAYFTAKAFSVPALGAALGCVSKAKVNQSIGNPENFNISSGTELETLALASGSLLSTFSATQLGTLKDKGYLLARKYTPWMGGSFFEAAPTAVVATSDYAWMPENRVVDKAIRLIEAVLVPKLQSTIKLNSDGTITDDVIGYYQDLVGDQLVTMMANGEISGDPSDITQMVLIDPAQNILQTSTLVITVKIVPTGTVDQITLNIGLTLSL